MLPETPSHILDRLHDFQKRVRDRIIHSRDAHNLHTAQRCSAADTIYHIDTVVDPLLEAFCEQWSHEYPLVLVAEGFEGPAGGATHVFPHGATENDAHIRLIVDPIDGTRGLMYDKRPAWTLAAVAPNNGPDTRLRDIELAVMTELPTSKMGSADLLWAAKGQGAHGRREDLATGETRPLTLHPSDATGIDHGFATISNFFPGTKVLAAELMEHLVRQLVGPADVHRATVFEDQYICTGGQFYELIVGHDRFNADLRSAFYRLQRQPQGLCVHPYDCATLLIAEEAGVIITDEMDNPLDAPLDVTTGISWAGYANKTLHDRIAPHLLDFLSRRARN